MGSYKLRVVAMAIILCLSFGALAACANANSGEAVAYVSLSINPETELIVDNNNKVLSVNSVNADAEVLLSDVDLIGMDVTAAAEKVVELCAETGYMNVDAASNEVKVAVVSASADVTTKIENSLETRLNNYFDNNGIFGKVSKATLEEYATQAAALGVSVGHMKMILRALDMNPDMTIEQLSAKPIKELVKLIKQNHISGDICRAIKEQLKIDKEALKVKYAELFVLENEVSALKKQLETFAGTDQEKIALEEAITTKTARLDELNKQYKAEIKALNDKAKADSAALRTQHKQEKQQKIKDNKSKLESHKNDFKKNEKKIKEDIQSWRKGLGK